MFWKIAVMKFALGKDPLYVVSWVTLKKILEHFQIFVDFLMDQTAINEWMLYVT